MEIPLIVKSPLSITLFEAAERLACFPTSVLIEGESGSGKEIIAQRIHTLSSRGNMPFVKINCGSIADQISDADLFGTDRGSSPSVRRNPGLFETANHGTLFLDDVGELSPTLQVRLLRFLQDRENDIPGGSWSKKVDIRIIASSTCSLSQLMKEKKFREDLYYRLHVAYLTVPPLRDRPEEILPFIEHYLDFFCKEYKIMKSFHPEALERLKHYSFPGNIRELRNLVEGLCVTTTSDCITPDQLPDYINASPVLGGSLESLLGEIEAGLIRKALSTEGSIRKAAVRLQVSHATLIRKMQKWGIEKEGQ